MCFSFCLFVFVFVLFVCLFVCFVVVFFFFFAVNNAVSVDLPCIPMKVLELLLLESLSAILEYVCIAKSGKV